MMKNQVEISVTAQAGKMAEHLPSFSSKGSSGIITSECVLKGQREKTLKICAHGGWAFWLLIALLK